MPWRPCAVRFRSEQRSIRCPPLRGLGRSDGGGDIMRALRRSARDNPVPLALIGAGAALLLAGGGPSTERISQGSREGRESMRQRKRRDDDTYPDLNDAQILGQDPFLLPPDAVRETRADPSVDPQTGEPLLPAAGLEHSGDRVVEVYEILESTDSDRPDLTPDMRETRERARRKAAETAEIARRRADEAREAPRTRGQTGAGRAADLGRQGQGFVHQNPLAGGAIALALGALAGGVLPRSKSEDAYFGETASRARSRTIDRAVAEARRARRVAEAATREALAAFGQEARTGFDPGPGGREAMDEAERTASSVADRAAAAAEAESDRQWRHGPTPR